MMVKAPWTTRIQQGYLALRNCPTQDFSSEELMENGNWFTAGGVAVVLDKRQSSCSGEKLLTWRAIFKMAKHGELSWDFMGFNMF